MFEFDDDILGRVCVKTRTGVRSIRMEFAPTGELLVTTPPHTPQRLVRWTVRSSRQKLLAMQRRSPKQTIYENGQIIGQSHRLVLVSSDMPVASKEKGLILIILKSGEQSTDPRVQLRIRTEVKKALRREAGLYLRERLRVLADRFHFSYESVRLAHQRTRWGSCSSNGTISLNIALMKLPLDLIDYVLIHELSHTKHMNHSASFWREVERCMPHYTIARSKLKQQSPSL